MSAARGTAGRAVGHGTGRTEPAGPGVSVAGLVSAAARGDESAWVELVRRYTPLVYAVIRSYDLGGADAADVNQTVWLRLVEHLDQVREPQALAAWLAVTTRRECYRMSRLGRRVQPVDPSDASLDAYHGTRADTTPPDEDLLRAERRQALREGFAQLPQRCQQLLALLTADPPLTYRETADRLGVPVGSIGPTQARCLRRLRDCPALAPYRGLDRAAPTNGGEHHGAVAAGR
ncbi:RNA polymerase sigma factor [Micromonospora endophytica]|uniref:Sigma-70 family RNA polymerase sigma factor n=1 Tax=Micromonospora endophytica TaxID=515350 RepID=A0A2W2CVM9_9ACTN|nr:sigma-70 family RNA polymerase sigma factor [Micromonospora endophytica]PZF95668.1 sigma-70 family RNA polymerase sigma factor [Micromonospora endophytica]RIW48203.1 sigma-70 family RNA polymerase sigma factor [Micromonospora endophytica]BCJ56763.1 RNA polymerase sigma factor [Micromonospora endophytica]